MANETKKDMAEAMGSAAAEEKKEQKNRKTFELLREPYVRKSDGQKSVYYEIEGKLFGKTCRASMTCKNRDFNIFEMLEDLYNPANELTKPVLEVVTEYSDSNGKRTKMVKYNAVSYDKDGRRYHVPMIPKKASDVAKIEMFLNE